MSRFTGTPYPPKPVQARQKREWGRGLLSSWGPQWLLAFLRMAFKFEGYLPSPAPLRAQAQTSRALSLPLHVQFPLSKMIFPAAFPLVQAPSPNRTAQKGGRVHCRAPRQASKGQAGEERRKRGAPVSTKSLSLRLPTSAPNAPAPGPRPKSARALDRGAGTVGQGLCSQAGMAGSGA